MTGFTRLVVVGSVKRATLVLPTDDPVSTHLGAIVKLVREPDPEGDLLTLVHSTGTGVDLSANLVSQGIIDGTMLHLVRARDVPPEPEVSDISDLVTHEYEANTAHKTAAGRHTAAMIAAGITSFILGAALVGAAPGWVAPVAWSVATALAVAFALLTWRAATRFAFAVSVGLGTVTMLSLAYRPWFAQMLGSAPDESGTGQSWPAIPWLLIALVSVTIGIVFGICERRVAPALGAIVGSVLGLTGYFSYFVTLHSDQAAAITGLVGVAALALLPGLALSLSGLTKLDDLRNDQQAGSNTVPRPRALRSIAHAYESLQWATLAIAVTLVLVIPMLLGSASGWFVSLGVIIAILTLLRARVVPLALSSWALSLSVILGLGVAALVYILGLTGSVDTSWLYDRSSVFLLGLGIALLLSVLLALLRPAAHASARLRRQGDLVESMLALSIVPVMLGGFGLYTALLGVF